jgi:hypothetical protein
MTDLYDVLRVANCVLAVTVLVGMLLLARVWAAEPYPHRLVGLATAALVLVALVGSAESVHQDAAPGVRVPLVTVALIWLAVALVVAARNRRRDRRR